MSAYATQSFLALMAQSTRAGLAGIDSSAAERPASVVLRFRDAAGGFRGRRGGADVYYTTFAVRSLHALERLDDNTRASVARYAAAQTPASIIDSVNLLELGLLLDRLLPKQEELLASVELFRAPDGGYSKTRGAKAGSTYHSFLAALAYNLFALPQPARDELRSFVKSRRRPDGGFCEDAIAARGSTNATAAGVALLMLLEDGDEAVFRHAAGFLLKMQHASGGWLAVQNAPVPDLLSTYTALVSLTSLGALPPQVLESAAAFAATCEKPEGGFGAGPWDDCADVEYTYYGLGVRALRGLQ